MQQDTQPHTEGTLQALPLVMVQEVLHGAGAPLAEGMYRPLMEPVEAWHFSMRCPPEESGRKHLDMHFTADGIFNAVLFWHTLELAPGVTISSAPALVSGTGEHRSHVSMCAPW